MLAPISPKFRYIFCGESREGRKEGRGGGGEEVEERWGVKKENKEKGDKINRMRGGQGRGEESEKGKKRQRNMQVGGENKSKELPYFHTNTLEESVLTSL